jgi:hypothetical protein
MIRIRFFADFVSSKDLKDLYLRLYNLLEESILYNKKYIIVDDNSYTHAILLNTYNKKLKILKENIIGLSYEPFNFLLLTEDKIKYIKENINKYYIGSHAEQLGKPFINEYSYITHIDIPKIIKEKRKIMSLMISNKIYAPGHKYRHILAQEILKTDLPIDIWGRGTKYYKIKDERLKTEFKDNELYEDYKFHIAIENYETPHYFSEKIINSLLYETTPIYIGCENIDDYFKNKCIKLTKDINKDIQILRDICNNPEKYIKEINRKEILDIVNIENLIKKEFL